MGIKNILLNTSTSNGPISVDIWKQYFKNVFLPAFVFIACPNFDHLATSKVPFAKPYFKCLAGDHIAHLNDFLRTRMGIFFTLMMQQGWQLISWSFLLNNFHHNNFVLAACLKFMSIVIALLSQYRQVWWMNSKDLNWEEHAYFRPKRVNFSLMLSKGWQILAE